MRPGGPVPGPVGVPHRPGGGQRAHGRPGERDVRRPAEQVRWRRVGGVHVRGRARAGRGTVAARHRFGRHSRAPARPALLVPAVRHVVRAPRRAVALHQLPVGQRHAGRVPGAQAAVQPRRLGLVAQVRAARAGPRVPRDGPAAAAGPARLQAAPRPGAGGLRDRRPRGHHQRPGPGPRVPVARRPHRPVPRFRRGVRCHVHGPPADRVRAGQPGGRRPGHGARRDRHHRRHVRLRGEAQAGRPEPRPQRRSARKRRHRRQGRLSDSHRYRVRRRLPDQGQKPGRRHSGGGGRVQQPRHDREGGGRISQQLIGVAAAEDDRPTSRHTGAAVTMRIVLRSTPLAPTRGQRLNL